LADAGGTDWNQAIASGRLAMKDIRDAVTLLRSSLMDIIVANPGNDEVINAMLDLSLKLDAISTASEDTQVAFIRLYEIGAGYREARKRKRKSPK